MFNFIYIAFLIIFLLFQEIWLHHFYFRKNDENLQLDDDHIITLKWAQERMSTLNDLAFLRIVLCFMSNVRQTGYSGTNISLHKRYRIPFFKVILHVITCLY